MIYNYKDIKEDTDAMVLAAHVIRDVIFSVILLTILLGSWGIVGAGERGVLLNFSAVQNRILGEGLYFKIPIYQQVKTLEVRTVKMEAEALAYSNDLQTVDAKIALNYHIDPLSVNKLYQEIGVDYENRIISPGIQEVIKAIVANYKAQDLIEKREKVKEEIKLALKERLTSRYILVDEFSIVNFDFSQEYERAIEAKQVAQQNALTAKNKLEQVKFEAEQRIAQAKGEAEAIKIQAEAITQQGGKDYVSLKSIEKWDGKLPINFVPGSAIPFVSLPNY